MKDFVPAERLRLATDGLETAPEADQRLIAGLGDFDRRRAFLRESRNLFVDQLLGASHVAPGGTTA